MRTPIAFPVRLGRRRRHCQRIGQLGSRGLGEERACVQYGLRRNFEHGAIRRKLRWCAMADAGRRREAAMESNRSVEFFREQFDRQIDGADYQLNPFEQLALPHLHGNVLELGCGLGNLTLAAARRGLSVTALDACPNAVADLQRRALVERLAVRVEAADLAEWQAAATYDCVVAIGLLMFFTCDDGRRLLREMRRAVRPGGIVIVNVLVEGTTFLGMFDPQHYCLFPPRELAQTFGDWAVLLDRSDEFAAPGGTVKRFATLIAQRAR
jgi:tellurite methyltransferase